MKRNLYYSAVLKRRNHLKAHILTYAMLLCSYPRLLLELFIRGEFGERYYSLASVITATLILLGIPFFMESGHSYVPTGDILLRHSVWFLYTALFLGFGIKRQIEIIQRPSVFDFGYFSMSNGYREDWLIRLWSAICGDFPSSKTMLIYLEPLPFLLLGLVLLTFYPPLGILLVSCAILYSLSYMGEYWLGNNAILEIIDEIICNEETAKIVVEGKGPRETRGTDFLFNKPTDTAARQKLADHLIYDDGKGEAAASVI